MEKVLRSSHRADQYDYLEPPPATFSTNLAILRCSANSSDLQVHGSTCVMFADDALPAL